MVEPVFMGAAFVMHLRNVLIVIEHAVELLRADGQFIVNSPVAHSL